MSAIESLSLQLSDAMDQTTAAGHVLAAAEKHRDQIAERISALTNERASIVARRAGDKREAEDGSRLALIAADLEGLTAMQPDAVARVAEAKAAFDLASAAAAAAREEIGRAEALALREAIADATKRAGVGGRPPWGASRELRDLLRKVAAERGEL
jgi:chromosome segregation ATPase